MSEIHWRADFFLEFLQWLRMRYLLRKANIGEYIEGSF